MTVGVVILAALVLFYGPLFYLIRRYPLGGPSIRYRLHLDARPFVEEIKRAQASLEELDQRTTYWRNRADRDGVLLDLLSLACMAIAAIKAAELGERLVLAASALSMFWTCVRVVHEAALRDRRERREGRLMRSKATAALLFGAVLILSSSCGDQDKQPTGPTAVASASPTPSPAPTPSDTDPLSCRQTDLKLFVQNGAGNPDIVFDWREWLLAQSTAINAASVQIRTACYLEPKNGLTQVVGWNLSSTAVCEQAGDLNGFVTAFKCLQPGRLQIVASNGPFKAVWAGVLINARQDRDGRTIYWPDMVTLADGRVVAAGLYSSLGADGRTVLHQVRVSRERGLERLF